MKIKENPHLLLYTGTEDSRRKRNILEIYLIVTGKIYQTH